MDERVHTSMQLQRLKLRYHIVASHLDYLFSELLESGFRTGAGHVQLLYMWDGGKPIDWRGALVIYW